VLLFSGIAIVYILRVNMSVAVDAMTVQMNWSESQENLVLSSFYWGYALGQIPSTKLANRYGFKLFFGLSILLPSLLTLLVPLACATNFTLLLLLRAAIGLCEVCVYLSFKPK